MYGAFCVINQVLALRGSYHGDTLGAMEAQAPSPYTGFYQQPWYDLIFVKDFRFFFLAAAFRCCKRILLFLLGG